MSNLNAIKSASGRWGMRDLVTVCLFSGSLLIVGGGLSGCASDAQAGGLIGAGIGALAGQAIGGNSKGTLLGTAIGAGAGYVIGNESDKAKNRRSDYSDW